MASIIIFVCVCARAERGVAFKLRPWHRLIFGAPHVSVGVIAHASMSVALFGAAWRLHHQPVFTTDVSGCIIAQMQDSATGIYMSALNKSISCRGYQ
jgi:hypothetical protein